MAPTISQLRLDGPSKMRNCQVSWSINNECIPLKGVQYIKGTSNFVADSLSRYYQSDTDKDIHPTYDYVTADIQLDPEGEDLPWN